MKRKNAFVSWLKSPASDIWLFICAVVLLNLAASRLFFRLDITAQKSYSISPASRNAVKMLEEPLSVKVFFSSDLPSPYSNAAQYAKDLLSEYKAAANKNFSCEFFDMDKPDSQRIARGFGLNQVNIREIKNNEVGFKSAWMGIVLSYADQIEKLDGISSGDGLEYAITSAIGKIVSSTNILSGLQEPVVFTLYKSQSLEQFSISGFDRIDSEVQRAFDAANKKFGGRLELKKENPGSAAAAALSEKYGIQAVDWEDESGAVQFGAIGLVAEHGQKCKAVPLGIANAVISYVVSGLDGLEDNIAECAASVVSKSSVIAYSTGSGEHSVQDERDSLYFADLLSDTYTVQGVNLAEEDIPVSASSLIINGPRETFSEEALYRIDQFVLRGGNVMLLLDSYSELSAPGEMMYYQQPVYVPVDTGLEKLLSAWGISVGSEYVLDEKCFARSSQQYGKLEFYYVPRIQKNCLDQKNPISRNLGDVLFLQPFEITVSEEAEKQGARVSVIASSSERAWTVPVTEGFVLSPLAFFPPREEDQFSRRNLAVLLEGTFKSAFSSRPGSSEETESPFQAKAHLNAGTQNARILVVSTSGITTPAVLQQNSQEPVALFLRNAADYMSGKEEFCSMRTKTLSANTLNIFSGKLALAVKYFYQAGLSAVTVIAGICVFAARRRRKEKIRMRYNPDNPRCKNKKTEE
ncbi:MAG: Gldg family protein [Treponema sp.]|nr:Gldg family protein [Treponema sp.]